MFTTKTNIHHSKLPKLGEIGYLSLGKNRYGEYLYYQGKKTKYIVIAYPLTDNCLPYSLGIHTAFFKRLSDNTIHQLSGFYFDN